MRSSSGSYTLFQPTCFNNGGRCDWRRYDRHCRAGLAKVETVVVVVGLVALFVVRLQVLRPRRLPPQPPLDLPLPPCLLVFDEKYFRLA